MSGATTISVLVFLLSFNMTHAVAAQEVTTLNNTDTAPEIPQAPALLPIMDLRTEAPILSVNDQYDFRDYPMPSCGTAAPLCGSGPATQIFIALPANDAIVSSYIQTWNGGYWSFSLHKDFTLVNVGVDW